MTHFAPKCMLLLFSGFWLKLSANTTKGRHKAALSVF